MVKKWGGLSRPSRPASDGPDEGYVHHCYPLLLIDLQEKTINIIVQNIVYANSDSGLLFIMCGHCSPLVVWYNYHGTLT